MSPPSTQTWFQSRVTVVWQGQARRCPERRAPVGTMGKEKNHQLVVDVGHVGEGTVEKVAKTEAAKQAIQQGMGGIERLAGATVKDFGVWRAKEGYKRDQVLGGRRPEGGVPTDNN